MVDYANNNFGSAAGYQVGSIAPARKRFLPLVINPSVAETYTCGTFGTPQIALLYDADKNLFKFADLHTPIMTAPDNKSGAETPSVVKSVSGMTYAYDSKNLSAADGDDFTGRDGYYSGTKTATNDRQSGIIFTSITSQNKSNGVQTDFWTQLGFDVADIRDIKII